ncbi:hypothetical protein [Herbaspirillum sp. alder98]|uniref:hypothetical protein n=1 Tax=Herbaspirillum sp. alder98 TaxID=2913096 RepID=UPI001CD872CE|nr:hypothetical protein [Herbaspirillum sp. alder98]MCA1323583.1 hypothetical protein [Herbaspirillum sp. alder98]
MVALHLGAVNVAAAVCWGIALAAWLWGVPYWQERLRLQQSAIFDTRQALQAPMYPLSATPRMSERDRLKAFYDGLGDIHYVEQQVKTIFSLASTSGVALAQADYRMTEEKAGGFSAYRIRFPVKGSYKAVRQFCMQVLMAIPFASLDELQFKRAAVSSEVIEVNLQLTLYLNNEGSAPRGAGAGLPGKDGGS